MTTVSQRKIVGIVPAAGQATRMAPLPFSKELYPIGFHHINEGLSLRLKPVGQYILEHFQRAWAPSFTRFLHEHLAELERAAGNTASPRLELHMGHVIMAAKESGLRVEGVHLPGAKFIDIGVPENLVMALRMQLAALQAP